jgi:hypothetical protein
MDKMNSQLQGLYRTLLKDQWRVKQVLRQDNHIEIQVAKDKERIVFVLDETHVEPMITLHTQYL